RRREGSRDQRRFASGQVRPGDTVHATVTVQELLPERRRVKLLTVCTVKGKVVIDGDALVMPTSRSARRRLIVGGVGSLATRRPRRSRHRFAGGKREATI